MGDTGSMLLGLLLTSITITVTGQFDANTAREEFNSGLVVFPPIALPLLVIALPLAALVLAVLRRTLAGKSPFAPDRGHLHHRLLDMGHSHVRAVLLMYLWAGIVAFAAVALSVFDSAAVVLTVTALVAVCAIGLIALPRLRRRGLLPWGRPRGVRSGDGVKR
jgi:UDP-GlcNAc:undecaprenyl-phosphate GlcNAc-1-phosphate transferase